MHASRSSSASARSAKDRAATIPPTQSAAIARAVVRRGRSFSATLRSNTLTIALCAATAPSLLKLQDKYGTRGFQVIGVFHPKPAGDWNLARVERAAAWYHFTFPVADDGDWQALKRWWLNSAHREYTSVSFIVDKHGVIRYVHPGGEYHESAGSPAHEICDASFKTIDKTIATLLNENRLGPSDDSRQI